MLPTESLAELDALWSEFWPATDIKPLAVIDFINSVFFIRYLEEVQEKKERAAQFYNKSAENPIYADDQQAFKWSAFQHMDKNELYQLFNRPENNVLQFSKSAREYHKWSKFDEGNVPLVAIPELLVKTVKMVSNLETADVHTRAEMNKYLLKKVEEAAQKPTDALPAIPEGLRPIKRQRSFLQGWNVAVILLFIFISGFAIAYFYFGSKNKVDTTAISSNTADTAITPLPTENLVKKESLEKKTGQNRNNSKKEKIVTAEHKTTTPKQKELKKDVPDGEIKGKYKIVSKAYFHNEPDESTRRNAFVVHWNNSYATLNALDEENGFVYVVFRNHQNQTSKGWLRKKDLKPVD